MVDDVLKTPHLYFSYTYDLTHSLQRLHNTMPEFLQVGKKSVLNFQIICRFLIILFFLEWRCPYMRELMKGLFGIGI